MWLQMIMVGSSGHHAAIARADVVMSIHMASPGFASSASHLIARPPGPLRPLRQDDGGATCCEAPKAWWIDDFGIGARVCRGRARSKGSDD